MESLQLALADHQGWCCAYCEIRLTHPKAVADEPANLVVEHFFPKRSSTPTKNWNLDEHNLLACCAGGTKHYRAPPHAFGDPSFAANHSCDQRKLDKHPHNEMLDPRRLPPHHVFEVASNGVISVDTQRCAQHGVDPRLAAATIDFLNLNCLRLQSRRAEIHADATLLFNMAESALAADPATVLPRLRAALLEPDGNNRDAEFETTRLSVLGHLR